MSWYSTDRLRATRQIGADVFVVVWTALWWWVSRRVHEAIDAVAEPARSTAAAAQRLADDMSAADASAQQVPVVGESLGAPFASASGGLADVAAAASEQVRTVEQVADVAGWVVLLLPVALVVALWLPRRVQFVLASRAARRHLDAHGDLELFALRALATQPVPVLARVSEDPVGAWRRGDADVVGRLAELELRRVGLRLPPVDAAPGRS